MENIRDWCISRQLWWGHRIPVWYCQECGEIICSKEDPNHCPNCESAELKQDEDVLDTWFSSALWPFSTLGWPDKTRDLDFFYPTTVLVTGRDIIFFWVARMIFSGIEHMGEVPFYDVNIHGLILDAQGRKMSKSLNNGIDPIEVIEKFGADTLRFSLITGVTPGNDVRFHWDKVENTRNFANKIWNASRFVLMNMEGFEAIKPGLEELSLADRWILSRLQLTIAEVTSLLDKYDLGEAARRLYEFIWDEFCDWYIELAKPRLVNQANPRERLVVQNVLRDVLVDILRLLHPFMPFITEEIYQFLPAHSATIMLDPWPESKEELIWLAEVEQMQQLMQAIRALRNIRSEFNINPSILIKAIMVVPDEVRRQVFMDNQAIIKQMARLEQLELLYELEKKPEQAVSALLSLAEIYVPLEGIIDVEKEIQRLQKELKAAESDLQKAENKLNNQKFLSKAPPEVIEKERSKAGEAINRKEGILQRLHLLKK